MLPEPEDATLAVIGGTILSVLLMLISVFALHALPDKKPPAPQRVVTVCSGCGSEWVLVSSLEEDETPMKPITTCPNCPLSTDEFERLKEQVRKRKTGGGE
jgi:hypothetical protein